MKISDIQLIPYSIELTEPFVISLGEMTHANNLAVRITTDDGLVGWGECSPFLPINGETPETGVIVGEYLAGILSGINPANIDMIHHLMDKAVYGNTSLKSAIDIAIYDIMSQSEGLPLFRYLGANNNRVLKTDYTVSFNSIDKMVQQAIWIQEQGFSIIKIKLGGDPYEDIERVKKIREVINPDIPLRLDANQGWDVDGALLVLNTLKDNKVEICEEPILRGQLIDLKLIRDNSPIPIMADESCSDHLDAERLVSLKACDSINIKLGKSSGIYKALKIIDIAEFAGMPLQIGGFLESRLGFTASAHLAMCSELITGIDFDTPLMFSDDPVEGGIEYGEGGLITLPETPGLGATLNL